MRPIEAALRPEKAHANGSAVEVIVSMENAQPIAVEAAHHGRVEPAGVAAI